MAPSSSHGGAGLGPGHQRHQGTAAAVRGAGAGALAVHHPVRPAVVHAGARRRGVPGAGRRAVGARARRATRARPDRRRQGRPLVANRTSWVVTSTAPCCTRWPTGSRAAAAPAPARVKVPAKKVRARTLLCGEPGSIAGTCWNGSPYQPVPVAEDVKQQTAVSILEQGEDFPAVLVEPQNVRAYPSPYGINAAHVLGYLSPITSDELDRPRPSTTRRCTAPPSSAGPGLEKSTTVPARAARRQAGRRGLDGPGARRLRRGRRPRRRHPGHLHRRAGAGASWSSSSRRPSRPRGRPSTRSRGATTSPTPGAVVVMDAKNGRVVAMAGAPTYDPKVWVGGISPSSSRSSTPRRPATRCCSAPPRASSRPARRGSRS